LVNVGFDDLVIVIVGFVFVTSHPLRPMIIAVFSRPITTTTLTILGCWICWKKCQCMTWVAFQGVRTVSWMLHDMMFTVTKRNTARLWAAARSFPRKAFDLVYGGRNCRWRLSGCGCYSVVCCGYGTLVAAIDLTPIDLHFPRCHRRFCVSQRYLQDSRRPLTNAKWEWLAI